MSRRTLVLVSSVLLTLSLGGAPARAGGDVSIAAGDRTSSYHAIGRSLCHLLRRNVDGLTCSLLPAPRGDAAESYANLINVQNGAADIGLARSDWHYFGVTGSGPLKHVHETLGAVRSLFSIHSQPVALLVRRDSNIAKLDDLAGKRVNLGRAQSEDRRSLDLLMAAQKWTAKDFLLAEQITRSEQSLAFCHDRIQAMVFTVSHPNAAVRKVIELCDAMPLNLDGGLIDSVLAAHPYLAGATIPADTYPGIHEAVATFGATVTVVTSADVPEDLAYAIVKAVFDNLADLKKTHPVLRNLDPPGMVRSGLTAPFHIGAMRYYREKGLY